MKTINEIIEALSKYKVYPVIGEAINDLNQLKEHIVVNDYHDIRGSKNFTVNEKHMSMLREFFGHIKSSGQGLTEVAEFIGMDRCVLQGMYRRYKGNSVYRLKSKTKTLIETYNSMMAESKDDNVLSPSNDSNSHKLELNVNG